MIIEPIIGIDPGTYRSGVVVYTPGKIAECISQDMLNLNVLEFIRKSDARWVACENIQPQGQMFGHEIAKTCMWIGRINQRTIEVGKGFGLLDRKASICRNLLKKYNGNDVMIRQSLIKRLGVLTNGVAGHCWSALAVAVTFDDLYLREKRERNPQ